jgi:predicted MFS family arabinose efflux permease
MAASGLVWNSFGLFLLAIEAEFGWSRAAVSGAFGAFALTNAVSAPLLGYAMGRWDSRRLLAGLALAMGAALGASAFVTRLDLFWLAFGLVGGIGSHCFSSFAIFTILARRFRKRPATAMAIADAGSGLGAFLGLPLIQWMLMEVGWRGAYLVLGCLAAVLGVWLHLKVLDPIRRTIPNAAGEGARRWSVSAPLVAMGASYLCGSAAYQGLLTQQIALMTENGLGLGRAAWIAAWAGLVIFLWRLASGWLSDAWSLAGVMALASLAAAVTFAALGALMKFGSTSALIIYPLTMGVAFGGAQVLLAVGTRRIATSRDYAVVLGFGRLASGIGMAAGPFAAGFVHDLTGTYAGAVGLLMVLATVHFTTFAIAIRGKAQDALRR